MLTAKAEHRGTALLPRWQCVERVKPTMGSVNRPGLPSSSSCDERKSQALMAVPAGLPLGKGSCMGEIHAELGAELQSKTLETRSPLRLNSVLPSHCAQSPNSITGEAREPERLPPSSWTHRQKGSPGAEQEQPSCSTALPAAIHHQSRTQHASFPTMGEMVPAICICRMQNARKRNYST